MLLDQLFDRRDGSDMVAIAVVSRFEICSGDTPNLSEHCRTGT
jgi:hypothetical protein